MKKSICERLEELAPTCEDSLLLRKLRYSKVNELIEHVQQLIEDAGAYHSALELYELDGEAWVERAVNLLEEARKELP